MKTICTKKKCHWRTGQKYCFWQNCIYQRKAAEKKQPSIYIDMDISDLIDEIRMNHAWSYEAFAMQLGYSYMYVFSIIYGLNQPDDEFINRMHSKLGLSKTEKKRLAIVFQQMKDGKESNKQKHMERKN